MLKLLSLGLVLISLSGLTAPAAGLAVMSVDFGSEWMKVAIVSVRT